MQVEAGELFSGLWGKNVDPSAQSLQVPLVRRRYLLGRIPPGLVPWRDLSKLVIPPGNWVALTIAIFHVTHHQCRLVVTFPLLGNLSLDNFDHLVHLVGLNRGWWGWLGCVVPIRSCGGRLKGSLLKPFQCRFRVIVYVRIPEKFDFLNVMKQISKTKDKCQTQQRSWRIHYTSQPKCVRSGRAGAWIRRSWWNLDYFAR